MDERFSRLALLIGEDNIEKLRRSRVAVFGLGGVGGILAEALVRNGVGHLVLIDNDTVSISNLNRQIISSTDTVGESKTEVMRRRLLAIAPDTDITVYNCFYLPGNQEPIFDGCDYIADAIDTVSGKISLVEEGQKRGIPVISCMGTGNKLDPSRLEVSDITKTSVCPLARVMRQELKKRGIPHLKVVYSKEEPIRQPAPAEGQKSTPGSFMPVTSSAGLLMAAEIIKDLIKT